MYTKDTIENFVFTIENFNEITPAKQIDYFAYFLHFFIARYRRFARALYKYY